MEDRNNRNIGWAPPNLDRVRITVVGAARSGTSVAKLLAKHGARVFITEHDSDPGARTEQLLELGIASEFGGHSARALEADFLVLSPGVPTSTPLVQRALDLGKPVFSEVEVASWFCPAPIVAITGSNGKTTTSALVAHVFRSSGKEVALGGNIGYPFSDFVTKVSASGTVVLELSSFQLDHIDRFRPRVAVLLNITADHLDRYVSFEHYAESKFRIMENQRRGDTVIYNHDDALISNRVSSTADRTGAHRIPFGHSEQPGDGAFVRDDHLVIRLNQREEVVMPTGELALRGQHNVFNSLAAAAAARVMEIRSDVIRESLMTFEGIPHRLEFIRVVNGVRYVNDSKATNVNSVWYALESFNAPIVWIAGGRDKGNDYTQLKSLVSDKVRALIAIGEGADKLLSELGSMAGTSGRASTLSEAVAEAHRIGQTGDVVLLSPACASFDMFEDFEDRGNQFRKLVQQLGRR